MELNKLLKFIILISKIFNDLSSLLKAALAFLSTASFALMAVTVPSQWKQLHPYFFGQIFTQEKLLLVGILASGAVCLISINDIFWKKTVSSLERQLEIARKNNDLIAENIKTLFDGYLFQLSNRLEFGNGSKKSERITLYIHNANSKTFIPFGRFSHNAALSKPGRAEYPEDQGCISEAWQHGWCFDNQFENKEVQRLKRHVQRYKIDSESAKKMKMKSQTYVALRITDTKGQNLAVIVVESTESNKLNETNLKVFLEDQVDYLCELITNLKRHIPQPSHAKARGF